MKNLFNILIFLLFLTVISTSCKKDTSKSRVAKLDSLKTELDSLRNAVDKAWDSMIFEDNKKLDLLKRTVDESVYVLNVSEDDQTRFHNEIESLREFRYDRQSMSDSDLIDDYDEATNKTIQNIFSFLDSIENSNQVPLIRDLRIEIMEMDEMVIHRRGYYDEPAIRINWIIKNEADRLRKLGEPYASLDPYPLFILNPGI